MLTKLLVRNYVLINDLVFQPGRGLNTITGETGAGKSILIGALGLILGDRADSKSVGQTEGKCIIEGVFDIRDLDLETYFQRNDLDYLPSTILRREILDNGRSRAFVNDTPVSLTILRELGEQFVDIHSQHQVHQIADTSFMFQWLDAVCETNADAEAYRTEFKKLRKLEKSLTELKEIDQKESAQADYNNFLWDELDKAELRADELKKLEEEGELLQNAEEIGALIGSVYERIQESEISISDELRTFSKSLSKLAPDGSALADLAERLSSLSIDLVDVASELRASGESITTDGSRLELINNRIQLINQLLGKHRVQSMDELISIRDRLSDNLYENAGRQREMADLEAEVEQLEKRCLAQAHQLHNQRLKGIESVMGAMNTELLKLGLPNAYVQLQLEEGPVLTRHGKSTFQLLFSPNKGQILQPAHSVASGGELSRLMLVIKAQMAKYRKLPSIIFDEIDTGVSGEIAKRMADVMRDLSTDLQVIAITHLPQIAASGAHHFYVYKEDDAFATHTSIRSLNGEERVTEIAKMLSGDTPSEGALANAQELLSLPR